MHYHIISVRTTHNKCQETLFVQYMYVSERKKYWLTYQIFKSPNIGLKNVISVRL